MTQYSGKVIRKTPVTPTQASASGVWKLNEQAAAIRNNSWPIAGVPDPISRSVRFRSSASASLTRTPAIASNRQTWTWSAWVKRGSLGSLQIISLAGTSGTNDTGFYFLNTERIEFYTRTSGTLQGYVTTSAVFRDPSAWYHLVFVLDSTNATAANRMQIYCNGVLQTVTINNTLPQNTNGFYSSNVGHFIGSTSTGGSYFDGYMTEINFIDGQALTPSSFGTTDPLTGAWIPLQYRGTYGTNGFYVDFRDNTSTTTLGLDYSGNANNWTANNISLTAGSTYDSMLDVPTPWVGYTTTTDTSAVTRGNYSTLNPVNPPNGVTISGGNLNFACTDDTTPREAFCTMGMRTGKWYFEATKTNSCDRFYAGIVPSIYKPGEGISFGKLSFNTSTSSNITVMMAVDFDAGLYWVGSSGTWTGNPSAGTGGTSFTVGSNDWVALVGGYRETQPSAVGNINLGQRPFLYTVPTAFKAMCATNLPTPTILNGAQYMAASTYTATGTTPQTIVNSGNNTTATSFKPDLVWTKSRSAAFNNVLNDSVRGSQFYLFSNLTNAEVNDSTYLTSFNSNGFSLGTGNFTNGTTMVGWQWRAAGSSVTNTAGSITSTVNANTTAGFSIVSFVNASGTNQATVGHGLGVAPRLIIAKNRDTNANNWAVFHASVCDTTSKFLRLNTTDALVTFSTVWGAALPTSSVFGVTGGGIATASVNMIAYCFAAVDGYSAFGSYTGNGSSDGPFVFCGFRPRWVMVKRTDASADWYIVDTSRSTSGGNNIVDQKLYPNLSVAENGGSGETTSTNNFDILSNGFKCRTTNGNTNASGGTYIFAAFAENPFKYSNAR